MIAFAAWLADATIKGSILILLVAALHRVAGRRFDPRWRHLLWVLVVLRLMMPVAPSSSWSLFALLPGEERLAVAGPAPAPAVVALGGEEAAESIILPSARPAMLGGLMAVWLIGALLLALRTLIASLRTQRAVTRALRRSPPDPLLDAVVDACRRQLAIARPVRAVECALVRTPALHGVLRPVILLPQGMAGTFTSAELRHVVLHELWHLRRFDVAVSWLLSAVQTLHWFNPLVWFASARIREERELACDELALSLLEEDERTGYGMTILKLLERFRAPAPIPALVGIVNHKRKMKRRLTMIASFRNRTRFPMLFVLTLAAVAAAGLTDAPERRIIHANGQRLDNRVSLEMTNASISELLGAVATQAGLPVTQAPEVATNEIQQARFTLKAENVPAYTLLGEALRPFKLTAEADAAGITVKPGEGKRVRVRKRDDGEQGALEHREKKVIVRKHKGEEAHAALAEVEAEAGDGEIRRIEVRKIKKDDAAASADGKHRTELTLKFVDNGVRSEGRLTLEITR